MSFEKTLTKRLSVAVNEHMYRFLESLATEYNLDKETLKSLWTGNSTKSVAKSVSDDNLSNLTRAELVQLCKQKSLKCSGTKSELLERLLGKDNGQPKRAPGPKKVPSKKTHVSREKKVLDTLAQMSPKTTVRRNKFGNHVHPETSFVFDSETREVVGKQNDDGTVSSLSKEDVETCVRFKLKARMPENLTTSDVVIEEEQTDEQELETLERELGEVSEDDVDASESEGVEE